MCSEICILQRTRVKNVKRSKGSYKWQQEIVNAAAGPWRWTSEESVPGSWSDHLIIFWDLSHVCLATAHFEALQASKSQTQANRRPDSLSEQLFTSTWSWWWWWWWQKCCQFSTKHEGEERRAGAKEKKTEEKKEEEEKDGEEGKKEAEEEVNANEDGESKKKKEKRKNTRSTNKGEGFELNTPQPAATKAIEKDEDFPAPEFHLSINATTPRKGRAPQHSILPRRERGRAPTKR